MCEDKYYCNRLIPKYALCTSQKKASVLYKLIIFNAVTALLFLGAAVLGGTAKCLQETKGTCTVGAINHRTLEHQQRGMWTYWPSLCCEHDSD